MNKKSTDQDIRVVKRKKRHEEHHGGAWKVAYADFVTAMMAFFLVMWILSLSDSVKASIAGYFQDPKGFMEAVQAGDLPFALSEDHLPMTEQEKEQERNRLQVAKETIEHMVAATPEFRELKDHVDIRLSDDGLRIDLLEAKESLFFDTASAQVNTEASNLLSKVAGELSKLPNKIIVEGHTDIRPLARSDGYSNWELSTDRANSARRVMEAAGLERDQIAQIRGYAATQPRHRADPTHFSNRRVSIVVVLRDSGDHHAKPGESGRGKAEILKNPDDSE